MCLQVDRRILAVCKHSLETPIKLHTYCHPVLDEMYKELEKLKKKKTPHLLTSVFSFQKFHLLPLLCSFFRETSSCTFAYIPGRRAFPGLCLQKLEASFLVEGSGGQGLHRPRALPHRGHFLLFLLLSQSLFLK